MYNRSYTSNRSSSDRSSRSFSNRRFSPSKFGGRRFSRRNPGQSIDISKFVNKAQEIKEEDQHVVENSFEDFDINTNLKTNILRKGFKDPMPIQDKAIPHLLQGKDLIGLANTGMGKTMAFLVPVLEKVLKDRSEKVLIITPTRELASQIDNELYSLTYRLDINKVLVMGGVSIGKQVSSLHRKYNFVIGTPGRLKDLSERGVLNFSAFRTIIVDEVDRMFDMGFSKDVKFILDQMPKDRQSLFFSATLDRKIEELIYSYSNDPVMVSVKTRDTAASVDQDIIKINRNESKIDVLDGLLSQSDLKKVLVFGRTKMGVQRLSEDLNKRGYKAVSIHGDKSQYERQKSLRLFKEGKADILVATDVAARGLDIPNVTHVINYEVPENYEDYIHRIGRTGRANKTGKALTFVS